MSNENPSSRRSPGTGSLYVRRDGQGTESWYGHWRDESGRQVKRVLGPKRKRGTRDGLTRVQAEKALRAKIDSQRLEGRRSPQDRLTLAEVGDRFIERKRAAALKTSTLESYESALRVHLKRFFDGRDVAKISAEDVEKFMAKKLESGLSAKTVRNYVGVLHSIFDYAVKKKWASTNPCAEVEEKPKSDPHGDIRFLDEVDLEALLRAEGDETRRTMYLTAAMTGLRQGELLALRWRDIDWTAARVRVRRNYVRGEYGTPKSRRSTRSVPLADRVAGELDLLHRASAFQGDEDLVFAHPVLGHPLDRSKLLKRFKAAVKLADAGQFEEVVKKGKDGKNKTELRPLTRFHDLRHTFGTRMAAAGVPMRTLQEWMGHRDLKTTLIYADYAPSVHEAAWVNRAFDGDAEDVEAPDAEPSPHSG
jgi:integrase